MWWIYLLIGIAVLVVLGLISKAVSGLGLLVKIVLFPVTTLIIVVKFIFKK